MTIGIIISTPLRSKEKAPTALFFSISNSIGLKLVT